MRIFSIVTPSLNQGAYIGECLQSVRTAATRAHSSVEHLVIDGGSVDATLDVLRGQAHAAWISAPDSGQSDAINRGFEQAGGDIFSYLCADDLLEPDALARVENVFETHPTADVVYGDAFFLESGWKRRKVAGEFSASRLCRRNFLFQPAVFWRRAVFEKHGKFDEQLRFCMDHEYWLRISADTTWAYLPEPLASCRLHAGAKTWSQLVPAWDEARAMQASYGIHWKPRWDALWMRLAGARLYHAKRFLFASLAARRTK